MNFKKIARNVLASVMALCLITSVTVPAFAQDSVMDKLVLSINSVFSPAGENFAELDDVDWDIIDISYYQPDVDWNTLANEVDGAIIRLGIRYTSSRAIAADSKLDSHYNGAKSCGMPVGCYFYSSALSVEQAVEEANWVISTIKDNGYYFDLPIYYDMEYSGQSALGKTACTDMAKAFCNTLTANGFIAGIYTNKYWATNYLDMDKLSDYTTWLAQYASVCTYGGAYEMWQHTSEASVSAISGDVDMSKCYKDFSSYIKENGYNGYDDLQTSAVIEDARGYYTVTGERVYVRSSPSTSGKALGIVVKGTQFYIHEVSGNWGRLKYSGTDGWISLSYIKLVGNGGFSTARKIGYHKATTTSGNLNLRAKPTESSEIIGKIPPETVIYVSEISDGWGKTSFNGKTGWVSLGYTDFITIVRYFDASGKSTMSDLPLKSGSSAKLAANAYSDGGKTFLGWATAKDGDVVYADKATVSASFSNIALYAVFEDAGENNDDGDDNGSSNSFIEFVNRIMKSFISVINGFIGFITRMF